MRKQRGFTHPGVILAIFIIAVGLIGLVIAGQHGGTKPSQTASNTAPKSTKPLDAWQTNTTWAGYLKKGKNITAVSGQWTVPNLLYSSDIRGSGAWIGVGGWTGSKLLQIGIVNFENQGVNVPSAFTQRYPLEPQNIEIPNFPVKSGDDISASIKKQSGDQWLLAITNLTTAQHFSKTVSYQPDKTTADWIFEWASSDKYSLPAFDEFSFSHLSFSGQADPLASTDRLKMVDGQKVLVEPSKLAADGHSFSLTYTGP